MPIALSRIALALILSTLVASAPAPDTTRPDRVDAIESHAPNDWHWWDLLESLSVAAAALVAIFGINAWRAQLRGTKEHDLAEQALTLFYEARDMIGAIRHPAGGGGEGSSRKAAPDEDQKIKEIRNQAYVGYERYQARQECFNKLHALRYRFMAIFGKDTVTPFLEIHKIVNEILFAYRRIGRDQEEIAKYVPPEKLRSSYERIDEAEKIIWDHGDEGSPDAIQERVENAVARMESYCEPILRRNNISWLRRFMPR